MIGIYKIKNKINGKCYIGSSKHIEKRFKEHVHLLNKGMHPNHRIQSDWTLFAKDDFYFEVIEELEETFELLEKEKFWIEKENSCEDGYNILFVYSHTLETKEKISKAHKGKDITESQKKGLEFGRGKKYFTEETYEKFRKKRGEGSATSKLSESEVIEILSKLKNKLMTQRELSKHYNISETQIFKIKKGIRWGHLKERMPELYE